MFKAKSGIHIGCRKLGMINQTRYFIPGKTIWGAVTAILSRKFMEVYDDKIYDDFKNFVRDHLIFSYFYPVVNENILYLLYEKELKFGNMSKEEFENKFISSYVSTAVDPASKTSEDGSLHEFEYISPKTRDGDEVCFTGYLFFNEGGNRQIFIKELNNDIVIEKSGREVQLFREIEKIQVGGERNYGFGWLELNEPKDRKFYYSGEVEMYNSKVKIDLKDLTLKNSGSNDMLALSHVLINPDFEFELIQGDIEPMVGREWNTKGAGQNPQFDGVALVPGTKFRLKKDTKLTKLTISKYGIWQIEAIK